MRKKILTKLPAPAHHLSKPLCIERWGEGPRGGSETYKNISNTHWDLVIHSSGYREGARKGPRLEVAASERQCFWGRIIERVKRLCSLGKRWWRERRENWRSCWVRFVDCINVNIVIVIIVLRVSKMLPLRKNAKRIHGISLYYLSQFHVTLQLSQKKSFILKSFYFHKVKNGQNETI